MRVQKYTPPPPLYGRTEEGVALIFRDPVYGYLCSHQSPFGKDKKWHFKRLPWSHFAPRQDANKTPRSYYVARKDQKVPRGSFMSHEKAKKFWGDPFMSHKRAKKFWEAYLCRMKRLKSFRALHLCRMKRSKSSECPFYFAWRHDSVFSPHYVA